MNISEKDPDNDDIDEIIYKGVEPTPGEHDSFFGSNPEGGQHFTVHEGEILKPEKD